MTDSVRAAAHAFLTYGSRLDAMVPQVTDEVMRFLPAEAAQRLASTQGDENRHALTQAELAATLEVDGRRPLYPQTYPRAVIGAARTRDPLWNLIVLNLVEWRTVHQFRVVGRRLGELGLRRLRAPLLDIAEDERRHVALGWENIASLGGADRRSIRLAADVVAALDRADQSVCRTIPEMLGLPDPTVLTYRTAADMEERLA